MIRFLTWLRKEPLVFFSFVLAASLFLGLQIMLAVARQGQASFIVLPMMMAVGFVALGALVAIVLRLKNGPGVEEPFEDDPE